MTPIQQIIQPFRQFFQRTAENGTASVLRSQFMNPTDVTTVLMIIGGDVVQKALAQTTGCWYTPVCFSFGWVAYSFMSLVAVLGDGRLLPAPDVSCRVINLQSGHGRDNKHWLIGRIVRDNEAYMSRKFPRASGGIRISVWEAVENRKNLNGVTHSYWGIHWWGVIIMVVQLGIASIPFALYQDWGVFLITAAGTFLSLVTGALPQWTTEKLPNRQHSEQNFALTTGNGSKDIMIVLGNGNSLNLEQLSTSETPRNPGPWEKFQNYRAPNTATPEGLPSRRRSSQLLVVKTRGGFPTGFFITYVMSILQAALWLALMASVSALSSNTWYLLVVGGIGMLHNGYLAAMEVNPTHRNLPLKLKETIMTRKVMDGIMDLEAAYRIGRGLLTEFFPGGLREDESNWWKGATVEYDRERTKQLHIRGPPRTEDNMPNYNVDSKLLQPREMPSHVNKSTEVSTQSEEPSPGPLSGINQVRLRNDQPVSTLGTLRDSSITRPFVSSRRTAIGNFPQALDSEVGNPRATLTTGLPLALPDSRGSPISQRASEAHSSDADDLEDIDITGGLYRSAPDWT